MSQNFTPFPTTINDGFAPGAPGDLANVQPRIFTSHNYLAGEDVDGSGVVKSQVRAGNFVWALPVDASADPNRGPSQMVIGRLPDGATGGAAMPAGLAKRWLRYPGDYRVTAEKDLLVIPVGYPVETLEYATVFVKASTACVRDDVVYASNTDGSISTAAPGGSAPSGYSETGWTVVDGGAAGQIITITRWQPAR